MRAIKTSLAGGKVAESSKGSLRRFLRAIIRAKNTAVSTYNGNESNDIRG